MVLVRQASPATPGRLSRQASLLWQPKLRCVVAGRIPHVELSLSHADSLERYAMASAANAVRQVLLLCCYREAAKSLYKERASQRLMVPDPETTCGDTALLDLAQLPTPRDSEEVLTSLLRGEVVDLSLRTSGLFRIHLLKHYFKFSTPDRAFSALIMQVDALRCAAAGTLSVEREVVTSSLTSRSAAVRANT